MIMNFRPLFLALLVMGGAPSCIQSTSHQPQEMKLSVDRVVLEPSASIFIESEHWQGQCERQNYQDVSCTFPLTPDVDAGQLSLVFGDSASGCKQDGRWAEHCPWPVHLENEEGFDGRSDTPTWAWSSSLLPTDVSVIWEGREGAVSDGWLLLQEQSSGVFLGGAIRNGSLFADSINCPVWNSDVQDSCTIPLGPTYKAWAFIQEGTAAVSLRDWDSSIQAPQFMIPCSAGGGVCGSEQCSDSNGEPRVETCDGEDEDCDGLIDEGFDQDYDGFTTCGGDCNDDDFTQSPVVYDQMNGLDDDCDGKIDESINTTATPSGAVDPTSTNIPAETEEPVATGTYGDQTSTDSLGTPTVAVNSPTPISTLDPTSFPTGTPGEPTDDDTYPAATETRQLPHQTVPPDEPGTQTQVTPSDYLNTATEIGQATPPEPSTAGQDLTESPGDPTYGQPTGSAGAETPTGTEIPTPTP